MAVELTPRERILKALAFQEADIVPYHLMIDECKARIWNSTPLKIPFDAG